MPLAPEAAAWLEARRNDPPRSALTMAETRAAFRRVCAATAEAPEMARVEALAVPAGPRARQYWPTVAASLPLLVWLHGGRFISGDLETHDGLCRALARAAGCRVLAVEYRLAPEHPFPAAALDARAGLGFALEASDRVAIGGDSVGGCLAAAAALEFRDRANLLAQVLIYPMLDPDCASASHREFAQGYGPGSADLRRGWELYQGERAGGGESAGGEMAGGRRGGAALSPWFAASLAGAPPALVLTAEYDCLRDEGEEYARRLCAAGVATRSHRFEGMIHGFFQMPRVFPAARAAVAEAAEFLNGNWRAGRAGAGDGAGGKAGGDMLGSR